MPPEASPLTLSQVHIDYANRVNFAFQQNAIPILRRIDIQNTTNIDLHNVVCQFTPRPAWAQPCEQSITLIPANSDYSLLDIPIELNFDYLSSLSDRVRGEIECTIRAKTMDDEPPQIIHQCVLQIDVFAFDEWTGLVSLPEILAAFVTPNIVFVEQILSSTADLLGAKTDSSALDGYQTKSKQRVYQILDSLFDAVREQAIRYSNPPASFEQTGQRVRFGEQIFRSKLATCLDLTLLFTSAIEAAGLRPIILMHSGHAYVGCWLIEESFPEPTIDDLQSIRKRVDLDAILVFESTTCCDGNAGDFSHAVNAGQLHLNKDDIFQNAIDVFCSRTSGIRPLPLSRGHSAIDPTTVNHLNNLPNAPIPYESSTHIFHEDILEPESISKTPEGRIEHWKYQLLDLTLRNRLLNFKETKQTIPLVCLSPEILEDELAAKNAFQILEQSKLMSGADPRSLSLQQRQSSKNPISEHLLNELQAKRLRSSLGMTQGHR